MRIWNQLKMDITFQFRHGFYYAYLFVTLIFCLIIVFIPLAFKQFVALFFILTDTSVLGFFFIGGVLLLEKKQDLLNNAAITPLRLCEYILAKVISFSLLSVVSSLIIQATALQVPQNGLLFFFTITFSSILYTLFGLVVGTIAKSLNQYFALSFCFAILIVPSAAYFLQWTPYEIFTIFPLTAIFMLIKSGIYATPIHLWSIIGLFLWNILFFVLAYLALYKVIYSHISFLRFYRSKRKKGART
ncbi:MAG: hypothetical protein JW822_00875 [Spirochaetales bacterium]|nr:hypothetical protein [Spirochaetales bacterium]